MRQLPPLHALRAFEAAARHLHFGRAAQELNLDPTAISHQVRKLEEILGVALFRRRPRPMRLTEAGERLYPEIRRAFDRMAGAVAAVNGDKAGTLVVSMTMAFAAEWFTPRLAALRAATGLDILVHAENNPVELHGTGIDLAIRSQQRRGENGHWRHLFDDCLIAVATPTFLEEHGNHSDARDLLTVPLIEYRWTSRQRSQLDWDQWFAEAGVEAKNLNIAAKFTEESHAVRAALSGIGVALLSERVIGARLEQGDLFRIGANALSAPAFWAVYRDDHPRAADLDLLIDRIAVC